MNLLSPAQIAGYISFVLGIIAFLQKNDQRLRFFNGAQTLVYSLHFLLLGNMSASASALVSATRSFLSLKYRSLYLAAAIVVVNLTVGAVLARTGAGWLPITATCVATVAIFTMKGIPLRVALLFCTLLWLANNILSRSVGGTLLEVFIASINTSTIVRMKRAGARPEAVPVLAGAPESLTTAD
jgi:hypothetical protein